MRLPQILQGTLAVVSTLFYGGNSTQNDVSHTRWDRDAKGGLLDEATLRLIKDHIQDSGVQGAALSVVASPNFTKADWSQSVYSFGVAGHQGQPVTEESLFSIASNSKLFTYMAIGNLILNGTILPDGQKLDFKTKVKDVLPEWQLQDPYMSAHVNVQDLLSMRSGMPRHDNYLSSTDVPVAEVLEGLRYLKPSTEIREAWQYNNLHYVALSEMVPRLTGLTFADYVEKHIFRPIGLQSATYSFEKARGTGQLTEGHLQRGYNATACALQWRDRAQVDDRCIGRTESLGWYVERDIPINQGPGGIILSGRDMSSWVKELLEPKTLSRVMLEKRHQGQGGVSSTSSFPEISDQIYGFAQATYWYRGERVVTHGGNVPGQSSMLLVLPDRGFGIFWAQNTGGHAADSLLMSVPLTVIDALLGLEPINWDKRMKDKIFVTPNKIDIPATTHAMDPFIARGEYHNPSYDKMTFQHISEQEKITGRKEALVANLLRNQYPPQVNTSSLFVAETGKVFQSHLVITPWSDGRFANWTGVNMYCPTFDGDKKCLAEIMSQGRALVTDKGIGLFDFWGSGPAVPRAIVDNTTAPEDAEVWFDKV